MTVHEVNSCHKCLSMLFKMNKSKYFCCDLSIFSAFIFFKMYQVKHGWLYSKCEQMEKCPFTELLLVICDTFQTEWTVPSTGKTGEVFKYQKNKMRMNMYLFFFFITANLCQYCNYVLLFSSCLLCCDGKKTPESAHSNWGGGKTLWRKQEKKK